MERVFVSVENVHFIINPMKKVLLFFFIVTSFSIRTTYVRGQEVDLRTAVAVVHSNHYESSIKFLKDFSNMFRKDGYKNAAKWLEKYTEGVMATGFVYQDSLTKQLFIVTNYNVVAFSEHVTVDFLGSDNKTMVKYEHCPVVAIHDKIDLAIIALPDSAQCSSLPIFQQEIKDGREVFTSSYLDLLGQPSFLFGKGIVSNFRFYSKSFADYKDIPLIQHTAQVDVGSAGSPLMIKSEEFEGGYAVVGVNTWKAWTRENTNLAIPAKYVVSLVNEYRNAKVELSDDQLLARANQFVNALDDYKKIVPFISYEYLSEVTPGDFKDWYNACPKDIKTIIKESEPLEGVRIALAYAIHIEALGKIVKVTDVDNDIVNMVYGNKSVTSQWVKEQGQLRVKRLSFFKPKTASKGFIIKDFASNGSVAFGVSNAIFSTSTSSLKSKLMYNLTLSVTLKTFVSFDFIFKYGSLPLTRVHHNFTTNTNDTMAFHVDNGFEYDFSVGFQLPVRVGLISFVPYVKPIVGINFKPEIPLLIYGVRSGLETGFPFNYRNYLLLGVGCQLCGFKDEERGKILKLNSLDVYLKMTF